MSKEVDAEWGEGAAIRLLYMSKDKKRYNDLQMAAIAEHYQKKCGELLGLGKMKTGDWNKLLKEWGK
jgi:hypothetical protein